MKKRIISALLAVFILVMFMPTNVFAARGAYKCSHNTNYIDKTTGSCTVSGCNGQAAGSIYSNASFGNGTSFYFTIPELIKGANAVWPDRYYFCKVTFFVGTTETLTFDTVNIPVRSLSAVNGNSVGGIVVPNGKDITITGGRFEKVTVKSGGKLTVTGGSIGLLTADSGSNVELLDSADIDKLDAKSGSNITVNTVKEVKDAVSFENAIKNSAVSTVKLADNIAISNDLLVNRSVTLDLNGYVLDLGEKTILAGDLTSLTMTIIDSRPTALHKFTDTDGLWISDTNGYKTVKGGVITNGGGINVGKESMVIMEGGNIVGCTASDGGGVYVLGTFTMNGGSITGCVAENRGGGIFALGVFSMNGGEIKNCTANEGGALYLKGTMNASGGTVDGTAVLSTKSSGSKGCIQNLNGSSDTEFKGDVTNAGLIDSGKFFCKVTVGSNAFEGIIRNGVFNGPVTSVSGGKTRITGGTFNDIVTIDRGTISKGTFNKDVVIKHTDGIPEGEKPELAGGTYNGLIKNESTEAKFTGAHSTLGIVGKSPNSDDNSYHKVTFNTAGGKMDYSERYFRNSEKTSDLIKATRDGYVFSGWFQLNGTKWNHSKDNVTSDITLTAHWSKILSHGGTESDPYRLTNAEELKAFRDIVDGKNGQTKNSKACAVLENDIVLNEGTFDEKGNYSLSNSGSEPEKWEPIGDYPNAFEGSFDGNGHMVYGVYVNTSGNRFGLFGNIKGAEIKNLSVTGYISEGHYTGGIAGHAESSVISNCKNYATIEAYSGSEACAGGIVGHINGAGSNITNCENHGTVISKVTEQDAYAGGITGYLIVSKNCGISGCINFGTIKGADRENKLEALYVGGIVGYSLSGKISDSYNAGELKNISVNRYKDSSVGGIAGYFANSAISDCYSVGKITANNSVKIGGIAGKTSGSIENCYYLSGLAKNAVGEIISGSPAINANAKSARKFADGTVLNALIKDRTGNENPWDSEGCKPVNDTDDTELPVLARQKLSIRHHGGTANCTQKAICTGCGKSYDNIDPLNHNPSGKNEWIKTLLTHERKWSCCNLISVSEENHNFKDAKCLKCKYECLHKDTLDLVKENGKYYYKCYVCDYETEKNDVPKISDGNGISVTLGDKKPLIFRSTASINEFIRVELDGETLDEKYYSKKEGSTIITLNEDFVSTLSVGTHTISIVSVGGTATAEFTINAPAVKTPETSPKTGYSEVFLALLSVAFLFGCITYKSLKKIKL